MPSMTALFQEGHFRRCSFSRFLLRLKNYSPFITDGHNSGEDAYRVGHWPRNSNCRWSTVASNRSQSNHRDICQFLGPLGCSSRLFG